MNTANQEPIATKLANRSMLLFALVHRTDEHGRPANSTIHPPQLSFGIHSSAPQAPDHRLKTAA